MNEPKICDKPNYIVQCFKDREPHHAQVKSNLRESLIYAARWLEEPYHQISIERDGEVCLCEVWDTID